jgi:hypothetical protein
VSKQHAAQVGEMLGDGNDNLFPAILKLVMADAVYCEPESESGNISYGGTVVLEVKCGNDDESIRDCIGALIVPMYIISSLLGASESGGYDCS